ncbi:hypothetical protein FQZ97_1088220 [compost metagenome]
MARAARAARALVRLPYVRAAAQAAAAAGAGVTAGKPRLGAWRIEDNAMLANSLRLVSWKAIET